MSAVPANFIPGFQELIYSIHGLRVVPEIVNVPGIGEGYKVCSTEVIGLQILNEIADVIIMHQLGLI